MFNFVACSTFPGRLRMVSTVNISSLFCIATFSYYLLLARPSKCIQFKLVLV